MTGSIPDRDRGGVETLTLPLDRKGWKGVPLAAIGLSEVDGHWRYRIEAYTHARDFWGFAHPLQHSPVATSRSDCLAAAIRSLRDSLHDSPLMARQLAWLDSLCAGPVAQPEQMDLFA